MRPARAASALGRGWLRAVLPDEVRPRSLPRCRRRLSPKPVVRTEDDSGVHQLALGPAAEAMLATGGVPRGRRSRRFFLHLPREDGIVKCHDARSRRHREEQFAMSYLAQTS